MLHDVENISTLSKEALKTKSSVNLSGENVSAMQPSHTDQEETKPSEKEESVLTENEAISEPEDTYQDEQKNQSPETEADVEKESQEETSTESRPTSAESSEKMKKNMLIFIDICNALLELNE